MIHTPPTYLGTLEVTYETTSLDTYINEIKYSDEKLAYCKPKKMEVFRYCRNPAPIFAITNDSTDVLMSCFNELFIDYHALFYIID